MTTEQRELLRNLLSAGLSATTAVAHIEEKYLTSDLYHLTNRLGDVIAISHRLIELGLLSGDVMDLRMRQKAKELDNYAHVQG